jgi:hypothetical protein
VCVCACVCGGGGEGESTYCVLRACCAALHARALWSCCCLMTAPPSPAHGQAQEHLKHVQRSTCLRSLVAYLTLYISVSPPSPAACPMVVQRCVCVEGGGCTLSLAQGPATRDSPLCGVPCTRTGGGHVGKLLRLKVAGEGNHLGIHEETFLPGPAPHHAGQRGPSHRGRCGRWVLRAWAVPTQAPVWDGEGQGQGGRGPRG